MRESYEGDEPVRDDLQLGVLAGEGDEPVLRNALTPPRPLPERSRSTGSRCSCQTPRVAGPAIAALASEGCSPGGDESGAARPGLSSMLGQQLVMPLPDPATRNPECARRTRAPPRESGADLRGSVDAIVVCHVSEKTSK